MGVKDKNQQREKAGGTEAGPPEKAPASPHRRLIVSAVLLLIVLYAAFRLQVYTTRFEAASLNDFDYLLLARDLTSGDYFGVQDADPATDPALRATPLYPALIAAGAALGADPEKAAAWISAVTAALVVAPLFLIGLRLHNEWAGFFAAALYAALPLSLLTGGGMTPESVFYLLTALAVLAAVRFAERPSNTRAALAGGLAGLSVLAVSTGLAYIVCVAAAVAVSARLFGLPWKRTAMLALAAVVAFLFCSGPGFVLFPAAIGHLHGTVAGESGSMEVLLASNLVLLEGALGWPLLVLCVAGLALMPDRSRPSLARESVLWIWTPAAVIFASLSASPGGPALLLPAAALACVWAGRGVVMIPAVAKKAASGKYASVALAAAITVVCVLLAFCLKADVDGARRARLWAVDTEKRNDVTAGVREAAETAVSSLNLPPGSRVLAATPVFSYYVKGVHAPAPETVEGVIEEIESGRVDYIFIDSLETRRFRKGLKPLLTGEDPLPGAGLIHRKYFPEIERLVSLYQVGAEPARAGLPPGQATPEQISQAMLKAAALKDRGYLEPARQLLEWAVEQGPGNAIAHRELMKLYMIYGNFDGVSFNRALDELMRYSFLEPGDPLIPQYRTTIRDLELTHRAKWGAPAGK